MVGPGQGLGRGSKAPKAPWFKLFWKTHDPFPNSSKACCKLQIQCNCFEKLVWMSKKVMLMTCRKLWKIVTLSLHIRISKKLETACFVSVSSLLTLPNHFCVCVCHPLATSTKEAVFVYSILSFIFKLFNRKLSIYHIFYLQYNVVCHCLWVSVSLIKEKNHCCISIIKIGK